MDPPLQKHEKIKLVEINSYLTCYLCKGYLIDATTISECLHSFCRSCIIKFLQENCYCPVCEVIINKAKPCLKLDKTLQDIVYKLVPGLFVKEMYRRKEFYRSRPSLALKVSPEERGEDTERTIFNPQDAISLSMEYISDDSAPGAIPSLATHKNGATVEEMQDNTMKRFLQCPGMCRIEVLKKFVRNKYNVDTNLFHIDILYKRVPLPDHYTLIDIGYIYSWKRNEPMKFFFRITDINKVAERFDYFNGRLSPDIVQKPPPRIKQHADKTPKERKRDTSQCAKKDKIEPVSVKNEERVTAAVNNDVNKTVKPNGAKVDKKSVKLNRSAAKAKSELKRVKTEKNEVILKPEITEELKSKIQNEKSDAKNSVYTNITLNREDNVEIITKIQKVSNKAGHPIGLNIINHTVKKTNKVQTNKVEASDPKPVPNSNSDTKKVETSSTTEEDIEKSNFLKSIELTAKTSLVAEKKEVKPVPSPSTSSSLPPLSSSSQKRKNSSPMKTVEKKPRIEKKPMKIIIQPKSIPNPTVRQMVTNVNQNVNNMSKIVESTTTTKTDLQSLIDNCKINIPASLSITLNEGGEGGARTPPSMPPVKNFIEILKLPDKDNNNKTKEKEKSSPTGAKDKNRNIQTFQRIFEESIVKKSPETPNTKTTPLDLTSPPEATSTPKRKILEIASQLHKKTKLEQEKHKEEVSTSNKIAIPRLATQRTLKPPSNKYEFPQGRPQTSASMHSSSLGLNYTVSVGQSKVNGDLKGHHEPKRATPSSSKNAGKPKSTPNGSNGTNSKNLSSNQLLEKYNIQNLAQLTASFNFNPASYGALQHAMLLKQMEHHSWLNQGPLLQFEKYMQSLSAAQSKMMGNVKEN